MTRAVILGIDPGVHRLGLAVCDVESGDPLWCGSHPISLPGGGHPHRQIGAALSYVETPAPYRAFGPTFTPPEPVIVAIEDPTHASRGKKQAAEWGGVMALVEAEARRRWPHIECWRVPVPKWKREVVGRGNADREEYAHHAVMSGWSLPVDDDRIDYDAAAAACVATWAFLTNQRGEVAA